MKHLGVPNKRDNVERRWVICVSEEFHKSVNDACSNFREFDSSNVDGLDEKLTVFRSLNHEGQFKKGKLVHTESDLFEISFLSFL